MYLRRGIRLGVLLIVLIAVLTPSITLPKPAEAQAPSKVLRIALDGDPIHLDQAHPAGWNSWAISTQLCEGFFRYRADGTREEAGITYLEISPDGKTYTLHLRTDAYWSDGVPVIAQHYVDALTRVKTAESRYFLDPVSTIKAPNNTTVEIVLNTPHAHFADALATQVIMCPVRLDIPEANRPFVTNGPYVLDEWITDVYLRLVKNDDYWGASQVLIDELVFSIIPDKLVQLNTYVDGDLDVAGFPDEAYHNIMIEPTLAPDVREIVRPGVRYIGLNHFQPPMDDPDLRAALASSVDREALLSALYTQFWQEPMTGVIPPTMPSYPLVPVGYDYNSDTAKAHLSAYLTTHGGVASDISIVIWTNPNPMVDEIAEMWHATLDINVEVVTIPWNDYLDQLGDCRFEPYPSTCTHHAYSLGWVTDYYNEWNILNDLFHPYSPRNHTHWDSSQYRALLTNAATAINEPTRIGFYQQAEEILVETDIAVIPLMNLDQLVLIKQDIYYEYPASGLPPSYMYWAINPLVVRNTADDGSGSLRQAIVEANLQAGLDVIRFDIPSSTDPGCDGAGICTIQPLAPLPPLSDPVIIDGYTQPGTSPNTNPPSQGSNAVLKIELDGSSVGTYAAGVEISAGNSTLRGLVINSFAASGVVIYSNGGNTIEGNFIGTDASGSVDMGNGFMGVWIQDSAENTIGGTTPDARNIISGNDGDGVATIGHDASGNQILGNLIGTDATGNFAIGNTTAGIRLNDSLNNRVGGIEIGARNIISGNINGVVISGPDFATTSTKNEIIGNYIGTDVTGMLDVGNTLHGFFIRGANDNIIGPNNVISGNDLTGVALIEEAAGNHVLGNYIGTDFSGTSSLPNAIGVSILLSPGNYIGGNTPEERNLISGNLGDGILIHGDVAIGNFVRGNYIGTDVTGVVSLANGGNGIRFAMLGGLPSGNIIGGQGTGEGNLISANQGSGVVINNGSYNNQVLGNFIGTDATGTAALGNAGAGVAIIDSPNNTIGGVLTGEGNVISANGVHGVHIAGPDAQGNSVEGNLIGTDASGTVDLGNAHGLIIENFASNNTIGGINLGSRNVISASVFSGVGINPGSTGNFVQGNYIGTDISGTLALGNVEHGIYLNASNNTIGGTETGAGNIISSNGLTGIVVNTGTAGNIIQGNFIGTDVTGTIDLGNTLEGVGIVESSGNIVGGVDPGARNLISGNGDNGIALNNNADDNTLRGNIIGADISGLLPLGNDGNGVWVYDSSGSEITLNHVAFNFGNGVQIEGSYAIENTISLNSIHDNAYEGIVNLNGGNLDLSPPVITSMLGDHIEGTAPPDSWIEIFADTAGEGGTYLGEAVADPSWTFDYELPLAGLNLTATATDGVGNTSEFSQAVQWVPDNCELNDSYHDACDVATKLGFSMSSEGTFSSYVSGPDDVDWFYFDLSGSVTPGDQITISLTGTGEDEQLPANYDLVVLADLEGEPNAVPAPLQGVPLQGVPLQGVPLQGVPLQGVDAQSVPLQGVPLQGVETNSIPLQGVPLQGVPLQGVPLQGVPLQGVPLQGVPLQGVPLQGVGFHQGKSPEVVSTLYRGGMSGRFYVLVWSSTGEFSLSPEDGSYEVTVTSDEVTVENCTTGLVMDETVDPLDSPIGNTTNPKTLILVHRQRMVSLYGEDRTDGLMDYLILGPTDAPGDDLLHHPLVDAVVVDLGDRIAYPDVQGAYTTWDDNGCSAESANFVTLEIKKTIVQLLDQYDSIENIVIVGNDKVIPFRRVPDGVVRTEDGATIPNEFDYQNEYVWDGDLIRAVGQTRTQYSPTYATLRLQYYLSDDFYADRAPVLLEHGYELSVPDMPIGRLVETPEDIQAYVEAFLTRGGNIGEGGEASITSLTTGYSFLLDQAEAIDSVFEEKSFIPHETLISDDWTRGYFEAEYLQIPRTHDVNAVNAHFDHWHMAPAVAFTEFDLISSGDLISENTSQLGTLFFSVGCHAGLNFPDEDIFDMDDPGALDLPQALMSEGVTLIGNWGFGYGDDAALAYSEELMLNFARQLGEASVGQALVDAKREYLLTQALMDPVHEKILMEAVYYGLPMWALNAEVTSLPEGVTASFAQETQNGLVVRDYAVDINTKERTAVITDRGTYYKLAEQTQVGLFRPVQPKASLDIGGVGDGIVAHGVLFVGGTYADVYDIDPVITMPAWTRTVPELHYIYEGWDPARFWSLAQLENRDKTYEERLVIVPGQFLVDEPTTIANGATIGTERLYDTLDFQVYYAPAGEEFLPPIIGLVKAEILSGGGIWIKVAAEDQPDSNGGSSYVVRVIVSYTPEAGGKSWQSLDLTKDPGTGLWEGIVPISGPIDFFVQALDGSGNVGMFAGNGYYTPAELSIDGPSTVLVGQPVSFTTTHLLENPAVLWEFGDGALGEGADAIEHIFTESGEPALSVRIVDPEGNIGETSFQVVVIDDPSYMDDPVFWNLNDLRDYFANPERLPDDAINGKADNRRKTFLNKISAVLALIGSGELEDAINKLQHDLRAKMDGCPSVADQNDWIVDCSHQYLLRVRIDSIIASLETYQIGE